MKKSKIYSGKTSEFTVYNKILLAPRQKETCYHQKTDKQTNIRFLILNTTQLCNDRAMSIYF